MIDAVPYASGRVKGSDVRELVNVDKVRLRHAVRERVGDALIEKRNKNNKKKKKLVLVCAHIYLFLLDIRSSTSPAQ